MQIVAPRFAAIVIDEFDELKNTKIHSRWQKQQQKIGNLY